MLARYKVARSLAGWLRRPVYKTLYLLRNAYFLRFLYLKLEQKFLRRNKLMSLPTMVKINTGYLCNLRCPHCPTGLMNSGNTAAGPIPRKDLTFENLDFILSRIGSIHRVSLFGWGEPFLNKDIFPMIRRLQEENKYIYMDSNLSIKKTSIIDRIAESNIHFLSVSLDGVDEQSYAHYRIRGSFDLAFANMLRLNKAPNGPKRVEWQYILSKKNQHLLEAAKTMARSDDVPFRSFDMGLYSDIFFNFTDAMKKEWWTEEQQASSFVESKETRPSTCHYMYEEPFIDTDGKVYPCCNAPHAPKSVLDEGYENVFGDLRENTLAEIWNNDHYQFSRSMFTGRPYKGKPVKSVCLQCRVYLRCAGKSEDVLPDLPAEIEAQILDSEPAAVC